MNRIPLRAKRRLCLLLCLISVLLSACRGRGYADATERVPNNWALYHSEADSALSFRFEAGFTAQPLSDLVETLTYSVSLLGDRNRLTILGHYRSPQRDKGTYDYLSVGYYQLDRFLEAAELEGLMEEINDFPNVLSEGQLSVSLVQAARIRLYGGVTALTYSLMLTRGEVRCLMQIGLVPNGDTLYQVIYSDFSTVKDNAWLERMLSSLTLPAPAAAPDDD